MSVTLVCLVIFGLIILLILSSQPVAFAMVVTGLAGILWFLEGRGLSASGLIMFSTANSFVLTAIPLFLFMGEVLLRIGVTERLYKGLSPILRRFPGGLLHSNIGACAVFAAISGSSAATAATIGVVAIPEMERRGYDTKMIVGSLAGGGTLGVLIPPSIIMIIYAWLAEESVGQLFMGGVIPGVMTTLIYMIYIAIRVSLQPRLAPKEEAGMSRKDLLQALFSMGPVVLLVLAVLGTIYLGIATPTEAAALGASCSLLLGLVYRKVGWQMLKESALSATKTTCMLIFLMVGARLITYVLANLAVPRQLAAWATAAELGPTAIVLSVCLLYLVLGCFIQGISMMVLTLPVLLPIINALGINSVWFGIILVMLSEAALESPPVGFNLYVLQGIAPNATFGDIVVGTFPFFLLDVLAVFIVVFAPTLALWLPSTMFTMS